MAENGKAKYYALMEEMKTDILSGKIRPGEKLPSENQAQCTLWAEQAYGAKGSGDPGRRWIHRILSGKRNLLCGCAPSDSRDRKHRSGDYIYLGLYFSKADPGNR